MTKNLQLLYIRSNPMILFSLDQGTGCSEIEVFGADRIIFSNHGGHQLGQAIPNLQIYC